VVLFSTLPADETDQPGNMGYHWRQVFWHPTFRGGCVLGVHGNSGYLFAFKPPRVVGNRPVKASLEVITRITSSPSLRVGMFDQFSYGYLGFAIADYAGEPAVYCMAHRRRRRRRCPSNLSVPLHL